MKKQYALIPIGIVLAVIGFSIMNGVLDKIAPERLSGMDEQRKLLSTDYPIGTGLASLGVTCIVVVIMWKRKSSQKKP